MDWNLFWTAFGAIGGTIGALATFAAVFVALWQTKYNYKKKVRLSFSDKIVVASEHSSELYHYVGVTIVNIGNREVVIQNWGLDLVGNTKLMIAPDTSLIGRSIQVKLPHKLQIEESITLYYQKTLFHNALRDCLKENQLKANQKVKFYVSDSTSQKHYVLSNKTVEELLKDAIPKGKR